MDNQELLDTEVESLDVQQVESLQGEDKGREIFKDVYESDMLPNADYVLKCTCGYTKTIAKNVSGAANYIIPATGTHSLDVGCEGCGTTITLTFVESTPETKSETNDEQVLQESESSDEV